MQRKRNRSTLGTIGVGRVRLELGFAPSARTHTLMDITFHYSLLPAVDRAAHAGLNLLVRSPSARGIPAGATDVADTWGWRGWLQRRAAGGRSGRHRAQRGPSSAKCTHVSGVYGGVLPLSGSLS